ncbi:uncharacterized protein LOC132185033 [Corylus avellana]|uniref:uncharacterized protein LOC132185033 n=1 Tax=Corylus avellana TaxID=13451 RepID=UPI001E21AB67|nr:uncharacterized protein LOC132185033 [Corylus avellana]
MDGLTQVLVVAFAAGVSTFLLILVIWRWLCFRKREDLVQTITAKAPSFRATHGISRVHQAASVHHQPYYSDGKRRGNQHVFPRGVSGKHLFSWADHPSLINDAVENGWSQFAFSRNASAPARSTVLGLSCAVGDHGKEAEAEIIWEVFQGSAEFMQKIRFNSGLKRVSTSQPSSYAASVIRTSLPLPGPSLGNNSAFPQEAYFEITILNSHSDDDGSVGKVREGEKMKLIQDNSNAKISKVEELKMEGEESSKRDEAVKLSLGLTTGGSVPSKLPGTYPGSIGFNSNGSVLLDGIKLVFESEEEAEWGRTEKVIGCGFDPRQKKVFFTVDSQLLHVVHCKSEEFGTPMYPILAANAEILVVVNMGQSLFRYGPANAQRTSNPCFIRPPLNSPAAAMGYEDSSDLFSMTFDSQSLHASAIRGTQNSNNRQAKAPDHDPEVELFEIVLEHGRR